MRVTLVPFEFSGGRSWAADAHDARPRGFVAEPHDTWVVVNFRVPFWVP